MGKPPPRNLSPDAQPVALWTWFWSWFTSNRERIEPICAVLLVLITATYTWVSYGQLRESKESDRPWIAAHVEGDSKAGGYFRRDDKHRVTAAITLTNYGRSPAIDVVVFPKLVEDPSAFETAFDGSLEESSHYLDQGSVAPPGAKGDFITAVGTDMSKTDYEAAIHKDGGLGVIGVVRYRSAIDATERETDFCFSRLAAGAMNNCPTHNGFK